MWKVGHSATRLSQSTIITGHIPCSTGHIHCNAGHIHYNYSARIVPP